MKIGDSKFLSFRSRVFVFSYFYVFVFSGVFKFSRSFGVFKRKFNSPSRDQQNYVQKFKKKKTPSGEQQYCVEKFPMQPVECSDFERLPIRMTFSLFLVALEKSRNKKIPRDKVAVFFSRT